MGAGRGRDRLDTAALSVSLPRPTPLDVCVPLPSLAPRALTQGLLSQWTSGRRAASWQR